jgi:hypothetical protein
MWSVGQRKRIFCRSVVGRPDFRKEVEWLDHKFVNAKFVILQAKLRMVRVLGTTAISVMTGKNRWNARGSEGPSSSWGRTLHGWIQLCALSAWSNTKCKNVSYFSCWGVVSLGFEHNPISGCTGKLYHTLQLGDVFFPEFTSQIFMPCFMMFLIIRYNVPSAFLLQVHGPAIALSRKLKNSSCAAAPAQLRRNIY